MYFLLSGIFVFGADNPSENKSQTNRNSKKRFLPSLNKKGKSTAMSALLWLTDVFADCWKDGAPRIFDVIGFRVWVPLRISEAILFFTPNNVWLCLSVFINTERHFNTRHLDYRAATPYKYCSDCYGEFINVILGGRFFRFGTRLRRSAVLPNMSYYIINAIKAYKQCVPRFT